MSTPAPPPSGSAAPRAWAATGPAWAAIAIAALTFAAWLSAALTPVPGRLVPPRRWYADASFPKPAPPSYSSHARALLGGLDTGDTLVAGWVVERIEAPHARGPIRVIAARDGQRLFVRIVARGSEDQRPPIKTAAHDLYYERLDPPEPRLGPGELAAIMREIAERVYAGETELQDPPP